MPEFNRLGDRETQKRPPASNINLGPQRDAPPPEPHADPGVARAADIPAWNARGAPAT